MSHDLQVLFMAQEKTARRRAEWEGSEARMVLAQYEERMAHLLSQYDPVAALGIDRDRLRLLLSFVRHGDLRRLAREVSEACGEPKSPNVPPSHGERSTAT